MYKRFSFYIGVIGFVLSLFFGVYGIHSAVATGRQLVQAEIERDKHKIKIEYMEDQLDVLQKHNRHLEKLVSSTNVKASDIKSRLYEQEQRNTELQRKSDKASLKIDKLRTDSRKLQGKLDRASLKIDKLQIYNQWLLSQLSNTTKVIKATHNLVKSFSYENITRADLDELKANLKYMVEETSDDINTIDFSVIMRHIENNIEKSKKNNNLSDSMGTSNKLEKSSRKSEHEILAPPTLASPPHSLQLLD